MPDEQVSVSSKSRRKEDTFNILVATDIHLGYEETDPNIGEDSFVTFEEILIKANERDVDFILLGGDLFHHNNPSQKAMNRCMALLRKYTMGDRPVYFELLSNPAEAFNNMTQTVNYLDENLNISIPVFSIHGNHDDPCGNGHYSCLDTLSSAGLVNYFGKWTDLEKVVIKPILLRKGKTKIALYGLSHIKDDRLCRLFLEEKVKLVRPIEDLNDWYNVLVLHQNRVDRGLKRFIRESVIPDFINLIIWGHEHDCLIEPEQNLEKAFYVTQPGSSVATSLCEGETKTKHVGLLKIHMSDMMIKPLKLNTVRPFIWENLDLNDVPVTTENREKKSEEIKNYCIKKVEKMIKDAEKLLTGHPSQPKLPLIRLRCEYSDETQMFNLIKFGQLFYKKVANPNLEIVKFKKIMQRRVKQEGVDHKAEYDRLGELYKEDMEEAENFSACINHLVQDYFQNQAESKMLVLNPREMGEAVETFVEKDDTSAIENAVNEIFKKKSKLLIPLNFEDVDSLKAELEKIRDEDNKDGAKKQKDLNEKYQDKLGKKTDVEKMDSGSDTDEYELNGEPSGIGNGKDVNNQAKKTAARPARPNAPIMILSSDEDVADKISSDEEVPAKGRGRGRGRGTTTRGRGRGRGRGAAAAAVTADEDDAAPPAPSSTRKRTPRGATTRGASTSARKKASNQSSVLYDDSD